MTRPKHDDLDDEIRGHIAISIKERIENGEDPASARQAALKEFGNVPLMRDSIRSVWHPRWLDAVTAFGRDMRFAVRHLLKSPGFSLLAIVTLALGIGANTTMFSSINTIMLKPLPYPASAELDAIYRATPQNSEGPVSPADFLDFRREAQPYGDVAAFSAAEASLADPGRPAEMASAVRVTTNLLSILRMPPELGRDFTAGDDAAGAARIVIISQRAWQNRFGKRADIVGHAIRVDGERHEIIGVLPAAFNDYRHMGSFDLFRPLSLATGQAADRQATMLRLVGRRSGQRPSEASQEFLANFGARLAADFPDVNAGTTWRSVPLNRSITGTQGRLMMPMLIGLSGFVLLIACSNLANFLLARTMARAREFAVRSALGASRSQLLRPLIAESLVLALVGGLSAILVASWTTGWLSIRSTFENGDRVILPLDGAVFGWALAASLFTALAFGLAPALFALRLNLNQTLKSGARGTTGGRGHQRFRQVLIVGQFALAMVLLTGATLFIRGLDELHHRRSGWQSDHLATATVVLPRAQYADAKTITALHRLTIERLESLPGVASASVSSFTPFFNWPDTRRYLIEGREPPQPGHEPAALVNAISPRYFDTVGTRLLAGRAFTERDTLDSPKVFIINEAMAKGLFGGADPIGRRASQAGLQAVEWGEIVGVAFDVESVFPSQGPVIYQLYQPMAQAPRAKGEILVRTAGGAPAAMIDGIRLVMTGLDPDLPLRNLQPADARIYRANYTLGVMRDLLSSFALLGLGLAALGVYGVIARTMAQRTGEFAIRLALGASVRDITHMVLGSGAKLALVGSALGLAGAAGVSRLLAAAFPGMRFESAPAMTGAALFLITVALIACYLPARNASRISAAEALRLE